MKNILVLFFFISFCCDSKCQSAKDVFLEWDIFRITNTGLSYQNSAASRISDYLNGFRIGYHQNEKLDYRVGLRIIKQGTGQNTFDTTLKGIELNVGIEYSLIELWRLKLRCGAAFFWEKVNFYRFTVAEQGIFNLNEVRKYYGLGPEIKLEFKLHANIFIIGESRFRIGIQKYEVNNSAILQEMKKWQGDFNPLHTLGLKFIFL